MGGLSFLHFYFDIYMYVCMYVYIYIYIYIYIYTDFAFNKNSVYLQYTEAFCNKRRIL